MIIILLSKSANVSAQEHEGSIYFATTYLDGRTKDLQQYLDRSDRVRQRLLKKLKRIEKKIAKQLAAKDSALYRQYMGQKLSYDSIARIKDDNTTMARLGQKKSRVIDSLRGVQQFLQKQSGKLGGVTALGEKPVSTFPIPTS